MLIPIYAGTYDVAVTMSSVFCVYQQSKFYGLLATNQLRAKLDISEHHNTVVQDVDSKTIHIVGTREAKINDRKLSPDQSFIRDCTANCVLHAIQEGDFAIDLPVVYTGGEYNYTPRYQSYNWFTLYLGDLSIDISPAGSKRPRLLKSLAWWKHEENHPEGKPEDDNKLWKENQSDNPSDRVDMPTLSDQEYQSGEEVADDIVPGTRMVGVEGPIRRSASQEEIDHLLRDRGVYTSMVEPAYADKLTSQENIPDLADEIDPWVDIKRGPSKKSVTARTATGSLSGSLAGGSLKGQLKPPPPPPVEKVGDSLKFVDYGDPTSPILARRDPVLKPPPSDATPSLRSTLTGGFLKSKTDQRLARLTTEQRQYYERTKNSLGKGAAERYLKSIGC